jgi:ferredoxin
MEIDMAVKITDICISCDACLDECPVGAIVDNANISNLYCHIYSPKKFYKTLSK